MPIQSSKPVKPTSVIHTKMVFRRSSKYLLLWKKRKSMQVLEDIFYVQAFVDIWQKPPQFAPC